MRYSYTPRGVCPMNISFELDGDTVSGIQFTGGCNGNLKAIAKLVDGWTVEQIEEKLRGNTCGRKPTSCADQLAIAVRAAKDAQAKA
ncbi:MAG: TIGR03905 family TSCPD domain-containing protein [Ruminococcus sp.]|nr:TIGR03905 family TSCPD domain-containing protein [uncultured Ruminococcus sp.]MBQ4170411.1 TIGR03905 family TSCPD domain-containing protein [Ruminococcus sp.]